MGRDEAPVLLGERIRLRPYENRDASVRAGFGLSREIVRSFGGDLSEDGPLDLETAARQLTRRFGSGPHWVIADNSDEFVGVIRLAPLDEANRSANLAIGLFDPVRLGVGLGTEATLLVLAHAFDTLDLHRVSLTVLADNARAIACYHKCGFTTEGRLREVLWRGERWTDDLVMGALNPHHRR
ncbi:MAG: GNAT family N-acetyltransferase [Acidimicrobiales bacterium]